MTAGGCVIVSDCNKLVGILMLSSLAVIVLIAVAARFIRFLLVRCARERSGYRSAALAALAEMTEPESPRVSEPSGSPRLLQVKPTLIEKLVLSKSSKPQQASPPPSPLQLPVGARGSAAPPSPPPSPPSSGAVPLERIQALRAEHYAEDLEITPAMSSWSEAQLVSYFESGGAQMPPAASPPYNVPGRRTAAVADDDAHPNGPSTSGPAANGPAANSPAAPRVDPLDPIEPTSPSGGADEMTGSPCSPHAEEAADGGIARPKTFVQKFRELGYAPRDLYIIYSIKFAESTAYYAFSYIYTPYLSIEFGMSDIDAGILYALYGLLCSVFGLLAGPVIDSVSLRTALLIGTVPSFAARFGSALTQDGDFVALCSISALPIGAAFGLPVFALGVRRFTHPQNRAFAFTIFYAVLCASSAAGGLVIAFARAHFHETGLDLPWPFDVHLSWMRANVLLCSAFTLYTVAASCMIRNVRVQQSGPLETAGLESLASLRPTAPRSWAERKRVARVYIRTVYGDSAFWRLLVVSLIVALGTRATFRHLDATFPKYFMRTFGADAPFEVFVAIEPVITVLLSFPATFMLLRWRASTYRSLVAGTLLQSFCPLALMRSSYGNTLGFVLIMALGEAIWSPRLYEYSTMVAPEGFEGTFVAVAFVPQYVSAGVVGVTSGYLLDRYVPETLLPGEIRHPELLWGFVAAASFVTPLLLVALKRNLFHEEPTLQSDTQSVAVRRGPSGRSRAHGRYAMALPEGEVERPDDNDILE